MDENLGSRTARMLGRDAVDALASKRVAVFGLGGVGGMAAEAIARAGVGHMVLVDADRVSPSNLNRQIVALHSTLGRLKVDVMRDRLLDINPGLVLETHAVFIPATGSE
nr:ThiF family adenylyltransferase [Clostridia bacterium]